MKNLMFLEKFFCSEISIWAVFISYENWMGHYFAWRNQWIIDGWVFFLVVVVGGFLVVLFISGRKPWDSLFVAE